VRNTPISEAAIVGFATGAAATGMRPVAEIMHMDFTACAMDQIVNQAAKMRYMFGGKALLPMVIRTGVGGWLNAAAQHSQSLEAWFTHVPGLKVAAAGTAVDIQRLLLAAVADDNPVIVTEPLCLYERQEEIPDHPREYRLGTADVKRRGNDVTLVTWGATVPIVLEAAASLQEEGVSAEVIDLISLWPWDADTVVESVTRTSRAIVVHQANRRGGFGAEVATVVAERAFGYLDAPVLRVGGLDVPVPFSPPLEQYIVPSADRVVERVRSLG
jgi:pyruvate dehydrogenase E1 component beta subunit